MIGGNAHKPFPAYPAIATDGQMPEKDSTLLVLKVPKSLKAQIKEAARKRGHMTSASFIRELISKELGSHESALQNLEAQAMSTSAPMAVTVNDGGGARFTLVNSSFAALHGYSQDELKGKSVLFLVPDAEQAKMMEQVKALDLKDHFALISRHVRKDGAPLRVLLHISVFREKSARYSLMTLQELGSI